MFRHICASVVMAGLLALPSVLRAADEEAESPPKKPSVADAMSNFAKLGPGVHAIKKDKKGRIMSCVVVGQARISTALGKAKGIEMARDKANLAASAEFVKWLKEEVTAYQSADEENVILIEGTEGTDDDAVKESGKSVERSSKKMESLAKGLVRGLQPLHKEVDGKGKTYTIVKGWKADTAEGVKKIASNLGSDESSSKKSAKASNGKDAKASKKADKEIDSDKATSPDAGDFVP